MMFYCQGQILILIGIFLFCMQILKRLIIEMREMDVLALKDNGQLWANQYDQMPLQSVQAILISFSVVQILMMLAIMGYLFRFAQQGIQWSNKQEKSRSRGFFLVIGCIILPLYDCYLAYETTVMNKYVDQIPELESNLMPRYLMWIIYSLTLQTAIMALQGFFATSCSSKFMTQNFIYIKIFQFAMLVLLFVFMFINLINFQSLRGFGVSSYINDNWPRVLKSIDMREFDSGLLACEGGKYLQNT